LTGAGVLMVAAAGAALAWGVASSSTTTINACVAKNGLVSIYPAGEPCRHDETSTSWNTAGPTGPTGPAGPQGQQGPQGPAGALTIADPDAVDGTLTVTGQKQGDFGSGLTITGWTHEIVSPRDPASGLPTGQRQHKPLTITKPMDASSPFFLEALFTNENLTSVLIGLLSPSGEEVATVKLTNASVSDDVQHGSSESISFTYQKITWTWLDGGITAEDDWEAPSS
jgi:type VI secretion system secreted protein Hcp